MRFRIVITIVLFITCVSTGFSQYIRGFAGAVYNQEGSLYIVNPIEENKTEVTHITIDNMFRVKQEPETGIVHALDDTSWRARDDEYIVFQNKTVRVSDVLYSPIAHQIDLFGAFYPRTKQNIFIPKAGDKLAKRIYQENSIEIIKTDNSEGYKKLLDLLSSSRLVVFNNITEPSNKYIFKNMNIISYGERDGEGDSINIETYNDQEAIIRWKYNSNRGSFPGNYEIRVHYKIYNTPDFQATHEVSENLLLRLNQNRGAGIIMTLIKGTKVQVLETGNSELIDGINANWVKVQTEDGYVGWCFSGYLLR